MATRNSEMRSNHTSSVLYSDLVHNVDSLFDHMRERLQINNEKYDFDEKKISEYFDFTSSKNQLGQVIGDLHSCSEIPSYSSLKYVSQNGESQFFENDGFSKSSVENSLSRRSGDGMTIFTTSKYLGSNSIKSDDNPLTSLSRPSLSKTGNLSSCISERPSTSNGYSEYIVKLPEIYQDSSISKNNQDYKYEMIKDSLPIALEEFALNQTPVPQDLSNFIELVHKAINDRLSIAVVHSIYGCYRLVYESRALLDKLLKEIPISVTKCLTSIDSKDIDSENHIQGMFLRLHRFLQGDAKMDLYFNKLIKRPSIDPSAMRFNFSSGISMPHVFSSASLKCDNKLSDSKEIEKKFFASHSANRACSLDEQYHLQNQYDLVNSTNKEVSMVIKHEEMLHDQLETHQKSHSYFEKKEINYPDKRVSTIEAATQTSVTVSSTVSLNEYQVLQDEVLRFHREVNRLSLEKEQLLHSVKTLEEKLTLKEKVIRSVRFTLLEDYYSVGCDFFQRTLNSVLPASVSSSLSNIRSSSNIGTLSYSLAFPGVADKKNFFLSTKTVSPPNNTLQGILNAGIVHNDLEMGYSTPNYKIPEAQRNAISPTASLVSAKILNIKKKSSGLLKRQCDNDLPEARIIESVIGSSCRIPGKPTAMPLISSGGGGGNINKLTRFPVGNSGCEVIDEKKKFLNDSEHASLLIFLDSLLLAIQSGKGVNEKGDLVPLYHEELAEMRSKIESLKIKHRLELINLESKCNTLISEKPKNMAFFYSRCTEKKLMEVRNKISELRENIASLQMISKSVISQLKGDLDKSFKII